MSKPKFLYIDDESDSSVEAIRDGFNDEKLIEVSIEAPKPFADQRKYLQETLNSFDGLILDLRLDGNMKLDVAYNAPAIAQEIRTIVAQNKSSLKAKPIILCSTDEKMRATYSTDRTSHDLFDYKFLKGAQADWAKFSRKLKALAEGYNWINAGNVPLDKLLGREDVANLDSRITEKFLNSDLITFDVAHFITKDMFNHPGPLIKERVLAARFGVDIEQSKDWDKFKEVVLKDAIYQGAFASGWTRWWADIAANIFKAVTGKRLATVDAATRVALMSEATKITGLTAAKPLPHCTSSDFWTICEGYKSPLDPLEGFKVFETAELKPWQESKYISLQAVIERVGVQKGLRPQASEKDRIEAMKQAIK